MEISQVLSLEKETNKLNSNIKWKLKKGLLFVLGIIRDKSDELANPSVEETTEVFKKKILNQSYSTKETDKHNGKRKTQKSEISN